MFKLKHIIFTFICFSFFLTSKATHNRAGEITYKWLSGYTYEVKVTIFTEISGTNMADRCEDTVYFGDGTRAVVLRSNGMSTSACSGGYNGQPLNSNTKLNEYVTTHTYPGPGNYIISTEDPNRTAGIINIPNSVNQIFYLESLLVIPTFGTGNNSSPNFNQIPLDTGFVNQCFYHNPSAYDIDGDSISYELTYCRGTMGMNNSGYTYPATGGGIFSIDSITGILTWCTPQLQGDYNVATIIKEWRKDNGGNYFMIGYVLRDAQFKISYFASIQEMKTQNHTVSVSPNPFNEVLTISFNQNTNELFKIDLQDITGRKIKTMAENVSIDNQNNISLKIENLTQGIYFLKITGNNHTVITKKIIKQ